MFFAKTRLLFVFQWNIEVGTYLKKITVTSQFVYENKQPYGISEVIWKCIFSAGSYNKTENGNTYSQTDFYKNVLIISYLLFNNAYYWKFHQTRTYHQSLE